MARLALYTFALFRAPADDPRLRGFHARNDAVFAAAEASAGFLARSGYADQPGPASWGQEVYPRFYREQGEGWTPATLSLWRDLESAVAFAYAGVHAEALAHRRDWFRAGDWPAYAAWWVADHRRPDWAEACARHERLHDRGPGPQAFDFRRPFAPDGRPTTLDRARVEALTRRNARLAS